MHHHRRGLRRLLGDDTTGATLVADYREATLEPRTRAMLDYVARLTREPANLTRRDLEALRRHGWSDRDLLEIVEVAAYYAYANRIADGLGVELEEHATGEETEPGRE